MSASLRVALVVVLAVALGVAGGIAGVLWLQGGDEAPQPRPAFRLPDLEGQERDIAEWDGEIVVLNFWATWCAPCREEIPLFTELQQRYEGEGVQFLGVAIDRREKVEDYLDEIDMGYPTLLGMQSAMDVAADYGNERGTLPYTVVIDREGRMQEVFSGQVHREDLQPVLESLLERSG